MKNLNEITAIVREYLSDSSAVVTQPIVDSVNYLSNLFSIDMIDTDQSTVIDEDTLDIPDESRKVNSVFIAGEEVLPLKDLNDLETVRLNGTVRWYEFGGKIQFTATFSAVEEAKIYYEKGFIEPEATIDTDVPQNLLELVYIGAQYRYYNFLINQLVLSKADLPDIKPNELRKVRDDVKSHYFDIVREIKSNA